MEQSNPYQTPEAELLATDDSSTSALPFYVVGKRKAWILFIATFGAYAIYWSFAHWKAIKQSEDSKIMPVWRGIFSIFFCHKLFEKIHNRFTQEGGSSNWKHQTGATIFVLFEILSNIVDKVGDKLDDIYAVPSLILTFTCTFIAVNSLITAQNHINALAEKSSLELNQSLTPVNYIWIVLGSLMWLVILGSIAFITFSPEFLAAS